MLYNITSREGGNPSADTIPATLGPPGVTVNPWHQVIISAATSSSRRAHGRLCILRGYYECHFKMPYTMNEISVQVPCVQRYGGGSMNRHSSGLGLMPYIRY